MSRASAAAPPGAPDAPAGILIVDDHPLFAHSLALWLQDALGLPCQVETSVEAAEERLRTGGWRPQLALLDLELPGVSGLEGVSRLLALMPQLPIVVCSSHANGTLREAAHARGARACLGKSEAPERLLTTLRRALRAPMAAPDAPPPLPDAAQHGALTPRQREVLWLLTEGRSNKIIARRLDMSENTVRNHVAAILDRLGVDNRHEATTVARRLGLFPP